MELATRTSLVVAVAGAATVAGALLVPAAAYADVAPAPVLAGIAGAVVVALVAVVVVIVVAVVFILRAVRRRRGATPAAMRPVTSASPTPAGRTGESPEPSEQGVPAEQPPGAQDHRDPQ